MLGLEEIVAAFVIAVAVAHFYIVYMQLLGGYESYSRFIGAQLGLNSYMQYLNAQQGAILFKWDIPSDCGISNETFRMQKDYIYRISSSQEGTIVVYCNESSNID